MSRPERQRSVLDILKKFRGLEPLRELFWSELNYSRVNQPISCPEKVGYHVACLPVNREGASPVGPNGVPANATSLSEIEFDQRRINVLQTLARS